MNQNKVARFTAHYNSGLLSAAEVANALLFDLVSEEELDISFISSVRLLPDEIKRHFYRLLQEIKDANFRWTPFLVSTSEAYDPNEFSSKLRHVLYLLDQPKC